MITLNFPLHTMDQDNTFSFAYKGRKGEVVATGYLFKDHTENKIYLMKQDACLKSTYTEKDREESTRLTAQTPVRDGDIVEVEGKQYKVTILGNYSDAGRLTEV